MLVKNKTFQLFLCIVVIIFNIVLLKNDILPFLTSLIICIFGVYSLYIIISSITKKNKE